MKKLLLLLGCLPVAAFAQTFSNTTWTPIPNNNTDLFIPVQVSGLPNQINPGFGLGIICLKVTHQFTADLQIRLQSPDGKMVTLVDTKGGNSNGFPNTCFTENASGGWIQIAPAPFNGSYFPEQSINTFNDNSDPNGTWNLVLRDVFTPADTGSFHYVNITFMMNPPPDPVLSSGPCNSGNPAGCQCPDGISTDCDLLPDMTSSYLCIQNDHQEFPGNITLANATPNIGYGPLEIHGTGSCYCDTVAVPCSTPVCPDGTYPKELILQRVYHRDGNAMTYYDRPAGTMSYHPTHGHVHVDNWADFTLRRGTADPDARNWPVIGAGTKQSFCLVNLGDCDSDFGYCVDTAGNVLGKSDIPNSDFGTVTGCSRDQGIYVGNLDIYSSGLNGMGIILPPGTCNGDYYIVSITDPENNMLESNDQNNWVAVPITLTMQTNGNFPAAGYTYTVNGYTANFLSGAGSVDSMIWHWHDGSIPDTTTNPFISHTFPAPGEYIVSLYAYNTCGPTVTIDTIHILPVTAGIVSPETVTEFSAYPNPAKDHVTVTYTLVNPSPVQLSLLDAYGKKLLNLSPGLRSAGKYKDEIDLNALAVSPGIYFLELRSASGTRTIRFISF